MVARADVKAGVRKDLTSDVPHTIIKDKEQVSFQFKLDFVPVLANSRDGETLSNPSSPVSFTVRAHGSQRCRFTKNLSNKAQGGKTGTKCGLEIIEANPSSGLFQGNREVPTTEKDTIRIRLHRVRGKGVGVGRNIRVGIVRGGRRRRSHEIQTK